jgi:DNA polymerase III beta subunit
VGPNVSITGSNGDVQVQYRITGETEDNGIVTLPGSIFWRFVGAMPEGVVEIGGDAGGKVKMEGAGVKFGMSSGEDVDFPKMKEPKAGSAHAYIPSMTLREMLRKVKFAAAEDSTRAAICGVNMKLADDLFEMTAMDGRRLAHVEFGRKGTGDMNGASFDVTLANKTVGVLYGLLDNKGGDVDIVSDGSTIVFMCDKWMITAKVLASAYPGWRQIVPEQVAHEAKIGRVAFLEALMRVALASADGDNSAVRVTMKDKSVKFHAASKLAAADAEIDCCAIEDGGEAKFHFNPRLLCDALEAIEDDNFTFGFGDGGPGSPVLLKCVIPWLAVVMPLRID